MFNFHREWADEGSSTTEASHLIACIALTRLMTQWRFCNIKITCCTHKYWKLEGESHIIC